MTYALVDGPGITAALYSRDFHKLSMSIPRKQSSFLKALIVVSLEVLQPGI